MTAELRRARGWILGVALVMFGFDMIWLYAEYPGVVAAELRTWYLTVSCGTFGFFVAMWLVARFRPLLACWLALGGFWAMHAYFAVLDPSSLYQGAVLKVLFTLALIRGIQSANRAEQLKKELAQVFG